MIEKGLFIVGPARCATTLLHAVMSQHPRVVAPRVKEPLFFEAQWDQGIDWYLSTYFGGRPPAGAWILDSRHRHFALDFAQARIEEAVVEPKFVAVLRDPFDRCFSHWWHWAERLVEHRPFYQAVREEFDMVADGRADALSHWPEAYKVERRKCAARGYSRGFEMYVYYSLYARHLRRLVARFGRESVLVLRFADVTRDPVWALRSVCRLLSLDPEEALPLRKMSDVVRNRSLNYGVYERLREDAVRKAIPPKAKVMMVDEYEEAAELLYTEGAP